MIENIYCLMDRGANVALKPFMISRNDIAPVRETLEATTNPESIMHKHASDFELVHIATVNLETLAVEPVEPRTVARCIDLLEDQQRRAELKKV